MTFPSVIAGLDPAIHLLRKTLLENGWMRGSSPRMTARTVGTSCHAMTFKEIAR